MKFKSKKGLAGIDMVIAVIAVVIFSTLIVSLIYYNATENVKITKETLAMIYITEIFENIGMASYDDITEANINNLIPQGVDNGYTVDITIDNQNIENDEKEDIIKKITAKLTYEVGNKTYTCSMQRLKVKE